MFLGNTILLGLAGLFLGVFLTGQGTGLTQTPDKTLEEVLISEIQTDSGQQMYQDYCAACHGLDGKGFGPAVEFLKAPPPNLTTMAKHYNEKSVGLKVRSVLEFGRKTRRMEHSTCLFGDNCLVR
jgi:mono/diheme cytochrome c family protein